jgi:hypothetical protein
MPQKNVLGNVKTTLNRNVILTKDATLSSKSTLRSFLTRSMKSSLRFCLSLFFYVKHFYIVFPRILFIVVTELMKRMRDSNRFDSVWFYNCGIYGRTSDDKQFKFGLYVVMSSTKRTLFFKFFFARMTFLLASLLNSLTVIGFSPGRSEGKRCMATTSTICRKK